MKIVGVKLRTGSSLQRPENKGGSASDMVARHDSIRRENLVDYLKMRVC